MKISNKISDCYNRMYAMADLVKAVADLGRSLSGYGEIGYNEISGNVYVWSEMYSTTIYKNAYGDGTIYAGYTCSYCGEKYEMEITNDTTEEDLDEWVKSIIIDSDDCDRCENCFEEED